jgi:hypothetical protein
LGDLIFWDAIWGNAIPPSGIGWNNGVFEGMGSNDLIVEFDVL